MTCSKQQYSISCYPFTICLGQIRDIDVLAYDLDMNGAMQKSFSYPHDDYEAAVQQARSKMSATSRRHSRQTVLSFIAGLLFLAYLGRSMWAVGIPRDQEAPRAIFNRTLGVSDGHTLSSDKTNEHDQFEKIFAISFPERTDKRDSLIVASSFTGFDIEFSDGVSFESVNPKAAPAVSALSQYAVRHLLIWLRTGTMTRERRALLAAGGPIWTSCRGRLP